MIEQGELRMKAFLVVSAFGTPDLSNGRNWSQRHAPGIFVSISRGACAACRPLISRGLLPNSGHAIKLLEFAYNFWG
jgi:hypothetical protein